MSIPRPNKRKADASFPLAALSKRPRIDASESSEGDERDSSPGFYGYPLQSEATANGLMLPSVGGERFGTLAVRKERPLMRSNNTPHETALRNRKEVVVKRLRILVLDGEHSHSSGVLSALEILRELMTRVGYDIGVQDVLPWKLFDMIVGSGDGGWVALMLGRLKMSIARTIEEYQSIHAQIHHTTFATSAEERGLLYDNLLKSFVERASTNENSDEPLLSPLSEAQCLTVVPAMASQNMASPVLFRTYSARNFHFIQNCTVRSAMRAATNVLPVFPEHIIDGQSYVAASRFGHCNPISTTLSEARMMFPDADISTIVSIGSGHPGPIAYSESVPGATMIKLANDAEQWSSQAHKYFQAQGGDVYFRFNVDQGFQDYCLESGERYSAALAHTRAYCARTEVNERLNAAVSSLSSSQTPQSGSLVLSSTSCLDPCLKEQISKLRQIRSEDIHPKREILVAKGFRFQDAEIDSKPNKRFLVQRFTGSRARENRDRTLQLSIQAMHPGLLQVFGKSPDYGNDWIVYYDGEARPAEQLLSRALLDSDTNAVVRQGISLIENLSSALEFLYDQFNVSGHAQLYDTSLKDFVVFVKADSQYALALTPGHDESNKDSTAINVTLLQSLCSETLAQATIAAHRNKLLQDKDSFIHEVFNDNTSVPSDLSLMNSHASAPSTIPPHLIPSNEYSGADKEKQPLFEDSMLGIKDETDLRLYSWQKDTSAVHSLKSISEDFAESRPGAPIQENIRLSSPLDKHDHSSHFCPGYRRDDIRMSLSVRGCTIFIYDTPQQGEVCKACGKEHRPPTHTNPPMADQLKTAAKAPPLNPPPNPVAVRSGAPKPPAIVPLIPANPPPAPNIPTPAVAAPRNSPIPNIATFKGLSPQQKQSVLYQILNRGRACATRMDQMKALMLQPAVAGNPKRTKQVQVEYTKLEKALQAIKQTYTGMVKSLTDAQKPNFGQDLSTPPPASTPLGGLPGTPPSPYGALGHQRTPSQPLSPMTHARGPSNPSNSFPAAGEASSAPTQPTMQSAPQPGMPSDVASQMQKLIEQNRRHSGGQLEPPTFGPKAAMQASPPQPNPTPSSFGVPQQPPTSAPLNAIQPVWNGLITMQTASQTGQPIELMCYVIGMTGNPNHRANLWPQKMVISPSTMPKTPKSDEGVKEIFKKPTTVAATLVANPNPPMSIGSKNGGMFTLIQTAMAEKTVFSVFSWANLDGQATNVIFYPDETKIYMAVFPVGGAAQNQPSVPPPTFPTTAPLVNNPLSSMPPAEKVKFVDGLQLQLLAPRQQAQQGPTPMNFAALGSVGGSYANNSAGNAALDYLDPSTSL